MTRNQPPPIWAVVCTDVDGLRYVFDTWYSRKRAREEAARWRKDEKRRRPYSIVKYIPAPTAKRKGKRK